MNDVLREKIMDREFLNPREIDVNGPTNLAFTDFQFNLAISNKLHVNSMFLF